VIARKTPQQFHRSRAEASSARLLARMAAIDHHDASACARELIRCPRPAGTGSHDGHIELTHVSDATAKKASLRGNITRMSHPLVLALFSNPAAAAAGARAVHAIGITREHISVVSRTHDEEGALAEQMDATPGADIEDSRPAARLGELGAQVLAAIAMVLPGIGPIVAAGPLSAGLGEAAGHAAGSMASVLKNAGVPEERAEQMQREVETGAVLLGVHTDIVTAPAIREALAYSGAREVYVANWPQDSTVKPFRD
jgi:hypothetical protein